VTEAFNRQYYSLMLSADIQKAFGSLARQPGNGGGGDRGAQFSAQFSLDVQFEAPSGITILFGSSGSGKTSTLNCLAGILSPDRGRIVVNNSCLFDSSRRIDVKMRDRGVGYVFQNLALFPHLTARDNVEFGMTLPPPERKRKALAMMEAFRISHTESRKPAHISGGEAQRVALARALAADPKFLLLDEPLSAIDESTKFGIIADLKEINAELKLPIIYVTHSRNEAVALGERVVVFENGRVSAVGEPLEVFDVPLSHSIARLTGVENIFEGRIAAKNIEAGFMLVQVSDRSGSCLIDVPLGRREVGDSVTLAVRAGDILLATEEPRYTSARNVLKGSITELEAEADRIMLRVLSGVNWTVWVTRQAVDELKLGRGLTVWLAFKTHSSYLLDK